MLDEDRSCLSSWHPRLTAAGVGLAMPKTRIVAIDFNLDSFTRGKRPERLDELINRIKIAAGTIGYPCFLRTGRTAAMENWKRTCHLRDIKDVEFNVYHLWEASHELGLPTDVWAVQEMLKSRAAFFAFPGHTPITKRRRYFVQDGTVVFHHPFWPPQYILQPRSQCWRRLLRMVNEETGHETHLLTGYSEKVSRILKGYFALDWLWVDGRGWFLVDVADGNKSFRWDDYVSPKAKAKYREAKVEEDGNELETH